MNCKVLYFKGEIYNRNEFETLGDDAEFVLEAYRRHGSSALSKIRGSYVCVLDYDGRTILIRDQFGTIPLYYFNKQVDGKVLFSVFVKDLLNRGVPRKISRYGQFAYLSYGCVYAPYTLIDNVFIVPPGCYVVFDNNEVKVERYWQPSFDVISWRMEELQEVLNSELNRAIKEQTQYGNPCAFLSGGIDSSSIVAIWRQQYDGEIRTYCVTHEDARTDEREWARKVAERNHTRHKELLLEDRLIKKWLGEAVQSYDQPSLDGLNFWFATKLLKEDGESLVLSGEGGDELFMGYWKFIKHQLAYKYAPWVRKMPRPFGALVEKFASSEKVRKLSMLMGYKGDPYYVPRRILSDRQISLLARPELFADCTHLEDVNLENYAPYPDDLLNRISWLEMRTVVPDMWMRDGFQTSFSNGVSLRTPICDVRVAELLYTVPGNLKCDNTISKPLLVRAAGEGLPVECVTRPKQGFSLPFDRYFSGTVKDKINGFLAGNDLVILNEDSVKRLGAAYRNGKIYWSRIWVLFMIENWCKENRIEI